MESVWKFLHNNFAIETVQIIKSFKNSDKEYIYKEHSSFECKSQNGNTVLKRAVEIVKKNWIFLAYKQLE